MALDGTDVIKPTPFDHHEKIVRGPHTHSKEHGYQPVKDEPKPAEPEAPKAPKEGKK